jgi:hypothetical protein
MHSDVSSDELNTHKKRKDFGVTNAYAVGRKSVIAAKETAADGVSFHNGPNVSGPTGISNLQMDVMHPMPEVPLVYDNLDGDSVNNSNDPDLYSLQPVPPVPPTMQQAIDFEEDAETANGAEAGPAGMAEDMFADFEQQLGELAGSKASIYERAKKLQAPPGSVLALVRDSVLYSAYNYKVRYLLLITIHNMECHVFYLLCRWLLLWR